MKQFILFICILFIGIHVTVGQASNGLDVRNFLSPVSNFNYNSNASVDLSVRVQNDGPSMFLAQDSLIFDLTIGNNDTTIFLRVKHRVDATFMVGTRMDYVLVPNYSFSQEHNYTICATAVGSIQFPSNSTKNPRACVSFLVGLEDIQAQLGKVYYANQQIHFENPSKTKYHVFVYDITGKVLLEKSFNANSNSQSVSFNAPAKGFYFFKVQDLAGRNAIAKFVVN